MGKKLFFLLVLVCICVLLVCETTTRQSEIAATYGDGDIAATSIWTEDFQYALRRSQESAKPIFILFTGSDWCPPCMALDNEVFTQPEFAEYANQNFILFKADRPRFIEQSETLVEQNQELFRRFEIVGVPTIKIINYRENVLATTGYRAGGVLNYINHIKELLK